MTRHTRGGNDLLDRLRKVREEKIKNANIQNRKKKMVQEATENMINKIDSSIKDDDKPDKIVVNEDFKINKMKEKEKQEELIEKTKDVELRGEILDSKGDKTKFGEQVEEKLEELKSGELKEKPKFEIDARENALNTLWNISRENEDVIKQSYNAFGSEYGLYASIPMLCKGPDCVYAELYPDLHGELVQQGERCPVEVAIIMARYEQYKEDLSIDPKDAVDMSILRDVIDYDVQIVRAENKVAVEGDFVKDVVIGVSNSGVEIVQEQISQASEYKSRIQNQRNKALNLLNSTRKDKAGDKITHHLDPSSYTRELLSKLHQEQEVVEADFEEVNDDPFAGLEIVEDVPFVASQKKETKVGEE